MDLSKKNVIHIKKDGNEYLQFRKLMEYDDIVSHAYSLGIDKNYRTVQVNGEKLDEISYNRALSNYKEICDNLNLNYMNLVRPNQQHTDNVKIANRKINMAGPDFNLEEYSSTDGLITNNKDLILATTNADCILLMFFDPVKSVIANTHSGWRGTLQRISVKTVEKMQEGFECNPKDIICCICPSIRKCHFEVDVDVKELFEKEFDDLNIKESRKLMEKSNIQEKWNIDTVLINKIILEKKGLKPENIIDSGICSVCNSDLVHSFRVEKEGYGLATAIISLKGR